MPDLIRIQDVVQKVKSYHPKADVDLIQKAYVFAADAHKGQTRKSGEPYLSHPLAVADIVADLRLDEESICAAVLHDTVEDTEATLESIQEIFGKGITRLVDGLTKLSRIRFHSSEERQAENFRKMIVAMSRDLRVILVKLADRLHNMRTLDHLRDEKRQSIAQETLDIYAPLANRLGINAVKQELEDLSFRHLQAEEYGALVEKVKATRRARESYTRSVVSDIDKLLASYDLEARVTGRPKHLYSIWRKMRRQGIAFEHVYDLLGFRIITRTEKDCYQALGLIHMTWRPIPGRFKDYVALPKPNNYRSLHTAVIGPKGQRIEVQIRTDEMHRINEYGVAAHWAYKEGRAGSDSKFNWLKQLVEWQRELKDPEDFLDTLKLDLFTDDVYIFTPQGDLKVLPRGSTPVDFAYAIHSEVGDRCAGAMVNGRIVPLSSQLRNGDMVEVLTRDHQKPNADWIRFVRTSRAKNRIRAHRRKAQRMEAAALGRELLEREFKRYGTTLSKMTRQGGLARAAKALNLRAPEEVILQVGFRKVEAEPAARHALPASLLDRTPSAHTLPESEPQPTGLVDRVASSLRKKLLGTRSGICIDGLSDVMFRTANCCQPVPGERIIGHVNVGRGVTIHDRHCPNIRNVDPALLVEAYWDANTTGPYPTRLRVLCQNDTGKLAEMSQVFSARRINILSAHCKTQDELAINDFEVVVASAVQLESAMTALRRLPGVVSVERLRPSA